MFTLYIFEAVWQTLYDLGVVNASHYNFTLAGWAEDADWIHGFYHREFIIELLGVGGIDFLLQIHGTDVLGVSVGDLNEHECGDTVAMELDQHAKPGRKPGSATDTIPPLLTGSNVGVTAFPSF